MIIYILCFTQKPWYPKRFPKMAGWCFIIPPVIGFDPSPFWNGIIPPNQAAAGRSATNVARCDQPATPAAAPTPWKRLGIQWK